MTSPIEDTAEDPQGAGRCALWTPAAISKVVPETD